MTMEEGAMSRVYAVRQVGIVTGNDKDWVSFPKPWNARTQRLAVRYPP